MIKYMSNSYCERHQPTPVVSMDKCNATGDCGDDFDGDGYGDDYC